MDFSIKAIKYLHNRDVDNQPDEDQIEDDVIDDPVVEPVPVPAAAPPAAIIEQVDDSPKIVDSPNNDAKDELSEQNAKDDPGEPMDNEEMVSSSPSPSSTVDHTNESVSESTDL